jgi:hypothetical protein
MSKQAKCGVCGDLYVRLRPLQKACSPTCALKHAREQAERKLAKEKAKSRKVVREKLDAMQTKPQLVKKAQAAFNAFIRARDAGKPCISCSTPLTTDRVGGAFDCGHYRSVGSAPHMRFVEDNAHGQCKHCNRHLAGNHVEYRKGLIERIGYRAVELIESDTTLRKYTREGLIEIAKHYRAEARRLERAREAACQHFVAPSGSENEPNGI